MHKSKSLRTPGVLANGLFFLAFLYVSQSALASSCGPGAHWVATCAPSSEVTGVQLIFGVDQNFDGIAEYNAQLSGTATIKYGAPQMLGGTPLNPTYFMPIDIMGMNLIANAGPLKGISLVSGVMNGLAPNPGSYLHESRSDPTKAYAYLDYYFELRDTAFGTLHHQSDKTLWVSQTIDSTPVYGVDFRHTGCCGGTFISILDVNNAPIFQITDLVHTGGLLGALENRPLLTFYPVPIPAALPLFLSGLTGLWWMLNGVGLRKRVL